MTGRALRLALACALAAFLAPVRAQSAIPTGDAGRQGSSDATAAAEPDDEVAEAFVARCSGCHTIGGGPLTGPDLRVASQKANAEVRRLVKAMEPRVGPLDDALVENIVTLLQDPQAQKRVEAQREKLLADAMARYNPSPEEGERLFLGVTPLANGGPACAACHEVDGVGGSVGPDLTWLGDRMGQIELVAAIEKPGFKVMRTAYGGDHPVTTQEAYHLAAWFHDVAEQPRAELVPDDARSVAFAGGVAGIAVFALLAFVYRQRAGTTRSRLVRDAMRR